ACCRRGRRSARAAAASPARPSRRSGCARWSVAGVVRSATPGSSNPITATSADGLAATVTVVEELGSDAFCYVLLDDAGPTDVPGQGVVRPDGRHPLTKGE